MYNPYHLAGRVPNAATTFKCHYLPVKHGEWQQEFGLSSVLRKRNTCLKNAQKLLREIYLGHSPHFQRCQPF